MIFPENPPFHYSCGFKNYLGPQAIKMYTIFEFEDEQSGEILEGVFPRMAISEWLAFRLVGVALTK